MNREWRILVALEETVVPHPAPLLLGGPDGPLGTTFLIMARVDGFTPVGVLPAPYDTPAGARTSASPWSTRWPTWRRCRGGSAGLTGSAGRRGSWTGRCPAGSASSAATGPGTSPGWTGWRAGWKRTGRRGSPPALMHGDYSPYNVMASPRDTRRLAAVVDWDTGTIGDPLLDVGHLLARWTEPDEEPAIGVWDIEVRDGLPSRAELAARYADRTGADLSALPYYQALALFKLAIILEGSVAPAASASRAAERAAMVDRLIRYAGLFAREERAAAREVAR